MAAFGFGVLAEAVYKMTAAVVPVAETGNGLCFLLLFRHRSDDLNMRSTWLCSRNDIIANLSVLFAAAGVRVFDSGWPDILVGAAIAGLFLRSALAVLQESLAEMQKLKAESTIT